MTCVCKLFRLQALAWTGFHQVIKHRNQAVEADFWSGKFLIFFIMVPTPECCLRKRLEIPPLSHSQRFQRESIGAGTPAAIDFIRYIGSR